MQSLLLLPSAQGLGLLQASLLMQSHRGYVHRSDEMTLQSADKAAAGSKNATLVNIMMRRTTTVT